MGKGNSTRFWLDVWVGAVSLSDHFPHIYSVSVKKQTTVRDMWGWLWRAWDGGVTINELTELLPGLGWGSDIQWSYQRG
ncbi:hypothetical protein TSUD_285860 [Trifolium subterraneum]|uniref:Reverse transcriptase zinc-binding domain-containing protein n=1 Tax=Trifolium subterraneum TaxID=3900 RepID=A0A2Z6NQJ0_TRISU|nr:hypothetical protein TSUD_285860 [Trifolium subterraneum]